MGLESAERGLQNPFIQTCRYWSLFTDVAVAGANRANDLTWQFGAAGAESGVTFPTMVECSRQEAIEVISKKLFKFLARHSRLRHCVFQNARFEIASWWRHTSNPACLHGVLHFRQSLMTNGTAESMRRKRTVRLGIKRAIQVVSQTILKIRTNHYSFSFPPRDHFWATLTPAR